MNTLYLEYFIEIADQHSINKAAKKLMLNRSSLNVAMKALEDELGYPLFSRSPKGVELTSNGKKIYQDAKSILSQIESWRSLKPDQKLTLNFYVVPAINNIFSVALLSSYRKQNKTVEFHCFEITNSIDSIEPTLSKDNTLILGGHYSRDRQRLHSLASAKDFVIHELFSSQFVVYINKEHPYADKKMLTGTDLMKFDLILLNDFGPAPFYHFLEDTDFNTATSIPLIFDHISTNTQTATILPNILEKPLQLSNRNICSIPLVGCETTMNYFLVYKSALETRKDAHDFIDFILNYPFCV